MGPRPRSQTDLLSVRGHELPPELWQAMREGDWKASVESDIGRQFFPEHRWDCVDQVWLYDLRLCRKESDHLARDPMPEVFATVRGSDDASTLDPGRAVIIGDLGVDAPIALDFRTDPPRLVYSVLRDGPAWGEVGADLATFVSAMRREGAGYRREREILGRLPPPVLIAAHYAAVRRPRKGYACRRILAEKLGDRIRLYTSQEILDSCDDLTLIRIGETAEGKAVALRYLEGEPSVVVEHDGSWVAAAETPAAFYRGIRFGWWRHLRVRTRGSEGLLGMVWDAVVRRIRWGV